MTKLVFDIGLGGNFGFKVAPLIAFGTHMFASTQGVVKGRYSFPALSHPPRSLWGTNFGCFLSHNRITRVVRRNAANQVSAVLRNTSHRFLFFDSLLPICLFTGYW